MISIEQKTVSEFMKHNKHFWLKPGSAANEPFVCAYKLELDIEQEQVVRFNIHAEERYELFVNGRRIGRGSERGDYTYAFCEEYTVLLNAGRNVLVVKAWKLGNISPFAQMNIGCDFVLFSMIPEVNELLATGIAPWKVKLLNGYDFIYPHITCTTGANFVVDGKSFDWGAEKGLGKGWDIPIFESRDCVDNVLLVPAVLPQMTDRRIPSGYVRHIDTYCDEKPVPVLWQNNLHDEIINWNHLLKNQGSITIPPHNSRRIIIDLEDYYCMYTAMVVSGGDGGRIKISWAESLFLIDQAECFNHAKGNRDDIENKYFCGVSDIFKPAGGEQRKYENLWWQAGRYVEIQITTTAESLTINDIIFNETRYPFEPESEIRTSDTELNRILPLMIRTLQMCMHETYMDCPYYEQLMYIGDTRLQVLTTYVLTSDRRAPDKAVKLLGKSILASKLTQSRYPSREMQVIPPFSLFWIAMVYDYAMWNNAAETVAYLQNGVRGVLKTFREFKNESGLIESPDGWNFCDWAEDWNHGVPPSGDSGVSALLNWQYVMTLKMAAELEEYLNNSKKASLYLDEARNMATQIDRVFWDEKSGLYKDDFSGKHFSEHTQILALLSELVPVQKASAVVENLCKENSLTKTTIYFSHYLFEVFYKFNRTDKLLDALEHWKDLIKQGFKTTPERPEPSRSDCHGWGAHPVYHFYASLAGVRPSNFGGKEFRIHPQLGPLKEIEGTIQCSSEKIEFYFKQENGIFQAVIHIPSGIKAIFEYNNEEYQLNLGENKFLIAGNNYQLESAYIRNNYKNGGKMEKTAVKYN